MYITQLEDSEKDTYKMLEILPLPFEKRESKGSQYIKKEKQENDSLYPCVPNVVSVEILKPVFTERFALKLIFDNGECKKYVLPIDNSCEKNEVVSFDGYLFTDMIWNTAKIETSEEDHGGRRIHFKNDYNISTLKCYEEGSNYVEPELCEEVAYEDDEYKIERCWKLNVNSLFKDEETGIVKALISGTAFNYKGVSTFIDKAGKRLCTIDFDYIDNFHEGLAKVSKPGYGYGFIDKDMNLVIPMIYNSAGGFKGGMAKVQRDEKWLFVNKDGHEIEIDSAISGLRYQNVGEFNEGMCRVSTLKLGYKDLAYFSEHDNIAGIWGFINEEGKEVIEPQYIYAEDFYDGMAFVCKGKWTTDKKWNNNGDDGSYWTEEELWGAIDKEGNEVVPFIFDDIKYFSDINDVFMVHYGGWEDGHWGVIDSHGKWLAKPIFAYIAYDYYDGMFVFSNDDEEKIEYEYRGIYDIKKQKVIFEPQFFDVSFCDDGWIAVSIFDEKLGRRVKKLINRDGKEKFYSIYSSIIEWKKTYVVGLWDNDGWSYGLVDKDGNVLLPCEHDVFWNRIYYEQKLVVFQDGNHQGVRNFDGKIIIEPKYNEIDCVDDPILVVKVGEKEKYKEGLITNTGKEIIPIDYRHIYWLEENYFVCSKDDMCEMYHFIVKNME